MVHLYRRMYGQQDMYLFMSTSKPVRKVRRTRSIVGTTIEAKDCPTDGTNVGT